MMVQRMIGSKVGTAGSSGYQYLKSTIRLVQETLSFHVLQTEGYLTKFCTGRGHPEVQSLTLCLPLLTKKVSPYMPSIKKIVSHSYAWRSLVSSVRRSRVHLFELERPLECLSGSFLYPFPYRSSWNPYRSCREVLDFEEDAPIPCEGHRCYWNLNYHLVKRKKWNLPPSCYYFMTRILWISVSILQSHVTTTSPLTHWHWSASFKIIWFRMGSRIELIICHSWSYDWHTLTCGGRYKSPSF